MSSNPLAESVSLVGERYTRKATTYRRFFVKEDYDFGKTPSVLQVRRGRTHRYRYHTKTNSNDAQRKAKREKHLRVWTTTLRKSFPSLPTRIFRLPLLHVTIKDDHISTCNSNTIHRIHETTLLQSIHCPFPQLNRRHVLGLPHESSWRTSKQRRQWKMYLSRSLYPRMMVTNRRPLPLLRTTKATKCS